MRVLLIRFVCGLACFAAASVHAAERIALVVGNGNYHTIPSLPNATADGTLIASVLSDLGFRVTLVSDGNQTQLKRAIVAFGRALRDAGPDTTGLFYYAGHGIQSQGNNYLLPVDSEVTHAADLDVVAVEADWVLRQMFSARNRTNIIVLDACRDNPFGNVDGLKSRGLAEMNAPTGSFLSYATAPGNVAYDGEGGNSPFTSALARELRTPGLGIEQVFKKVRLAVLEETDGQQTPWDSSSLTAEFMFVPTTGPDSRMSDEERLLWSSVQDSMDATQFILFLRAYPESVYADEARKHLTDLMEAEVARAEDSADTPVPVAPASEPDQDEFALIAIARETGEKADYEGYLSQYPDGVFAEFSRAEIAAIDMRIAAAAPIPPTTLMTYDSVLTAGGEGIVGQTIADLARGMPRYPPVEGLPEEYWKEQQCSGCHQWTRPALCDQGRFYVNAQASRSLSKQHPYGGVFKNALSLWAQNDCR